tara:strand:+ start:205 stop:444 length:240 start_codon:yes stop_codon:yes gene_type:complete
MKKKKRNLVPSLHGDILIDTGSNKEPKNVVGYHSEPAGIGGGRVWREHKNGTLSWMVDTVMLSTATEMADALNAEVRNG